MGIGIKTGIMALAGNAFSNQYSVDFDGTDDYVNCGNDSSLQPTDEFSVSAWFKTNVVGDTGRNTIWSKNYFRLRVEGTSGKLHLAVYRSSGQLTNVYTPDGTSYSDGNWHHAVATFKQSDINRYKIYVDGALKAETTGYNSPVFASSHAFQIGTQNLGGANDMNGNIDEVAFWKTKLTLTDIQNIYTDGPNDISSYNPISWWRMGDNDGGTGTTVTDQGSGGNNGTLTNDAAFTTDVPS